MTIVMQRLQCAAAMRFTHLDYQRVSGQCRVDGWMVVVVVVVVVHVIDCVRTFASVLPVIVAPVFSRSTPASRRLEMY